jgi:hypothetical protein
MEPSVTNFEEKESSAFRATCEGTSSEAPSGATEHDPMKQGTGGTSLIKVERLFGSSSWGNQTEPGGAGDGCDSLDWGGTPTPPVVIS